MTWFGARSMTRFLKLPRTSRAMNPTSKAVLQSVLFAFLFVAVLTAVGLAFTPFHYPLMPGIGLAGLIFSNDVESDHRLRFEVAAIFFNTLMYALAIFFLLLQPRSPQRRRHRTGSY